jgi:hypothetical protein
MTEPHLTAEGRAVTVRVPISIRRPRWPEARART